LKDPIDNLGFLAAERPAGRPQIDETGRRQKRSSTKRGEMMKKRSDESVTWTGSGGAAVQVEGESKREKKKKTS